ncbi:MAG: CTP synthase (UTP-ammonia lyase) [Salibacteraceae bacterium]|jgi:CTP synthase (UTP-ammonia lyase)
MGQNLKIAIVGDYNFTYNSHHATNLAIDHSAQFLDLDINYYWVKLNEVVKFRPQQFDQFDAILIAPGPIKNPFFLHGIIKQIIGKNIPILITGEGYQIFIEVLINMYQLNRKNEKLISDNLVEGEQFEKLQILPHSKAFIQLYENYSDTELTSSRFSLYPQLISSLENDIADIEAYNHFEDPEIISLKNHDFFVGCGFCPQISSTREIPHPMIYTFIKAAEVSAQERVDKKPA